AGGLPMGATLVTDAVAASIRPGDHATTFGGGPLVSAVALHVLRRIADADFLAGVRARGEHLKDGLMQLRSLDAVIDVRGVGMMWGIELDRAAGPLVTNALEAGLLVTAAGEKVIRLLPPLTIAGADIDEAVSILHEVLR